MEAAVIMLGLSSEKIIDEQIDALLGYLSRNFTNEYAQMQTEISSIRMASAKFSCYKKYFDLIKNNVQDQHLKICCHQLIGWLSKYMRILLE